MARNGGLECSSFAVVWLQVSAAGDVASGVADVEDVEFPAGDGVVDEVGIAENGGDADAGKVGRAANLGKLCERCDRLHYALSHPLGTARIALREVGADVVKVGDGARG